MRNIATILLVIAVAVLGLYAYSQHGALRQQQRQLQELTAKLDAAPKTASLELQEKCAKQAREEFLGLGWGKHEGVTCPPFLVQS
jgi:uncharacterized membrane protein (Fun14 family)